MTASSVFNPDIPRPIRIEVYYDLIQVWVQRPFFGEELAELKANCAGGADVHRERPDFDRRYRQRLQLRRPNGRALHLIEMRDPFINRVDRALDWIFWSHEEANAAKCFVETYIWKKWNGRHKATLFRGTFYSSGRNSPNNFVAYSDKPSRTTSDRYCCHNEWRLKGHQAVKRAGLDSVKKLRELSHRSFWSDRLCLMVPIPERYGILYRRHYEPNKTSRKGRKLTVSGFPYDYDRRTGEIMFRACGSVMKLIEVSRFNISRALRRLPTTTLLPMINPHTTHEARIRRWLPRIFPDMPRENIRKHITSIRKSYLNQVRDVLGKVKASNRRAR